MGSHALEQPGRNPRDTNRIVEFFNRYVLSLANIVAIVAMLANQPGASPSLQLLAKIAPLPYWSLVFAAASLLLTTRHFEAGHGFAILGWVPIAYGSVVGLVTGATSSPSGSILLMGLTVTIAASHALGLQHRAAMRRAHKRSGNA